MTPLLFGSVVAVGAVAAVLRYLVGLAGARTSWPWPVLLVNVVASFAAGLGMHSPAAILVVTGFAGGLSTFSTLSVETIQLLQDGRRRAATASIALNLGLGVAAATVGWMLGVLLFG